ncbi:hypothetical protein [Pseudorhodoferax sp.]|uniref:hypothetical protein n=1 Tax=Pseudorhodoferax sp. TaxID=1993553 RepID=UPI002DD65300|nr:hypothetical protein [Pseudorhodoferax sp.]
MQTSSVWKFTRAPWSLRNQNRVSTDALSAAMRWRGNVPGRDFQELTDADADPAFFRFEALEGDTDAGLDLDRQCAEFGVERERAQPGELDGLAG